MLSSGARGAGAALAFAVLVATGACGAGRGTLTGAAGEGVIHTGAGGSTGFLGAGGSGQIPTGFAGVSGQSCGEIGQPVAKVTPEVLIVLDTSASMNDPIDGASATPSKWTAAVDGINSVVSSTQTQVSWGLSFIAAEADACDTGGIAVSPGADWAIMPALTNRTTAGALAAGGARPTRAAVALARAYLSGQGPGHQPVILLMTDGVPDCKPGAPDILSDDTAGAMRAVNDAASAGIRTFVVGLATSGGPADTALSSIATAGGFARTDSPAYFPASSSTDVVTAMNTLVAETTTCTFVVPDPPTNDGTTSRQDIGVRLSDSTSIPQDGENGWTYTDVSATAIQLHGSACDAVLNGGAAVFIFFICHVGL
jgi:hypothetical protein